MPRNQIIELIILTPKGQENITYYYEKTKDNQILSLSDHQVEMWKEGKKKWEEIQALEKLEDTKLEVVDNHEKSPEQTALLSPVNPSTSQTSQFLFREGEEDSTILEKPLKNSKTNFINRKITENSNTSEASIVNKQDCSLNPCLFTSLLENEAIKIQQKPKANNEKTNLQANAPQAAASFNEHKITIQQPLNFRESLIAKTIDTVVNFLVDCIL